MIEVYRGQDGWRWRLVAANGKIVADSGESYVKRSAILKAIDRVKDLMAAAGVVERLN